MPCKPSSSSDVKILSVQYFELNDKSALPTVHETKNGGSTSNINGSIKNKIDPFPNCKHVATVLEENETSNISKNSGSTHVFPTLNVSKKRRKERNGVGLNAKDLNGTPRSPNKKCTLRRHPPEDFDDPIVQPLNSLVNPGKGKYRTQILI